MPRNEAVPLEGEELPAAPQTRYASDLSRPAAPPTDAADGLPSAAWYQDPENPTGMRYWDGARWTEHRTDYVSAPAAPKRTSEGLVAAGYVLSFLFPIVGMIIGTMLITRKNSHGRWILALSLVFMAAFLAIGEAAGPNGN